MRLKPGVRLKNLQPQTVLAMLVTESVFYEFGVPFVVTSVDDGQHGLVTLHGTGRAFDARTKYEELNGREQMLRAKVQEELGPDFDVVIEAVGEEREHLHVEFDPR